MNKNKEDSKLVPEFRFPEFEKSEEWKEVQLISITDKNIKWSFTGGPFGSSLKSSDYVKESDGVRIIQLQNIGDGEFKNNYKIFTSKEKADELISNNIYPGDIIMSKMGDPVGRACLIPDFHARYVMSSDGIRVVVDEKKYDKYFIFSLINSEEFRTKVENSSTGSTRKRIGLSILKNLTFFVPKDKKEQKKIANTLTSLDDLIGAENEKLAALKAHKKGLLQQLFPAKGEQVPRLRFGEYKEEWEVKKFSNYIRLYRGSSPRPIKNYITTSDDGVNWIKIGDTKLASNFRISQVNEKITPKGAEKSRKVKKGELILANSMSYGATYQIDINGCIYDGWFVLREYEEFFNKQFLLQLLNSSYMQIQYERLAAGGIVQNISSEIVYNTMLPHTSKEEQEKIANCLSSLDDSIAAQSEKIEALQAHKKGLMQQLFPNVNIQK